VERRGTYQKGRRKITEPVLHVDLNKIPHMDPVLLEELNEELNSAVKKLDRNRIVLSKATGWLIALLVLLSLGAATYAGTSLWTRELQLERLREQVQELRKESAACKTRHLAVERRLVEIETELENLRD